MSDFPKTYRILSKQEYWLADFKLVPIRFQDRYKIMKWRNKQIRILRQKEIITKESQDRYFNEVVAPLFEQNKPRQVLLSFLKNDKLIGYGGLVHIDWHSRNAEISFLLSNEYNTEEKYLRYGSVFFKMISEVACNLELVKIYTYGYDVDDFRFIPLYRNQYSLEALLHEHVALKGEKKNIRIYAKYFIE